MGGAPREMLHGVHVADWSPDGLQIAIVRAKEGLTRIELPIGTAVYQTPGWVGAIRVHKDSQRIAFIDHPSSVSDSGTICVVDRKGEVRALSSGWGTVKGLAWSDGGRALAFNVVFDG